MTDAQKRSVERITRNYEAGAIDERDLKNQFISILMSLDATTLIEIMDRASR